jgi:NADH:ubiquinone oxidoreductase subunit F (NADH-binding)
MIKTISDLNKLKSAGDKLLKPKNIRIQVGSTASYGLGRQAGAVRKAFEKELSQQGVDASVVAVGCTGLAYKETIVDVLVPGQPKITYASVTAENVPALVKAIGQGKVLKKLALYRTDKEEIVSTGKTFTYAAKVSSQAGKVTAAKDHKVNQLQNRVVLRNAGIIDPESIEEYIARGGYAALCKAITKMTPEKTLEVVEQSGLRGRGGGGFPAGRKWRSCRDAKGKEKYILCNCSEGDPGISMHKSLIESDPHSIIEGMIIGGYAIGAQEGYIYLHYDYSNGNEKLQKAIDKATECGLLGKKIFGSKFSFSITLKEGAGAYVCGESTALMACLEGRAGEPRPKYVHTAEKGLWNKPTNLNNVETWANVAPIISRGAAWFKKIGTAGSPGTKVLSLTGNINTPCLVEVPMGTTMKQVITKLGGGMAKGSKLKAIGFGGPPAGLLPASSATLPIDFDRLSEAGSLLGSGGMIIMDESNCMVDLVRFFTKYLEEESCGCCFPCREGVKRMGEILEGFTIGIGKKEDIALLEELASCLSQAALCDLGKSAPASVRSLLCHFREELDTHIEQEVCPAKRCTM